ncbi:N-acetylmuramoyl-L-alanine amidase [Tropicimonas isoalkanivorans]|uniref:N-acetylmuramoyl-L-alanine amidase n=1 Tax=Tropicimonas isoalkanivorans TaxID=441112 RepID=A0A1I1JIH1_9RHOB|nr:N-acetylmuramoyl-L-alanine amidase [Tropicimonas isoalkanivorans]
MPDLVVLHFTAMDTAEAALERLCDPEAEVSCHYLIGRDGRCWHLVEEAERAWHAGAGSWGGRDDVNSHSIGIELDNRGAEPFSERLMTALERILPGILARWDIPPCRVIAHSDMAPGRKSDPGPRFDWRRLALCGLSCWPCGADDATAGGPTAFTAHLEAFGYPTNVPHDALLLAFRSRFRPWAAGPLEQADMALATDLARRFPIDRGRATA